MAHLGSATGYGPQAISIKSFDGNGDFDKLQKDLQNASVFSDISSMDPKCQQALVEYEKQIAQLRLGDNTAKNTAELAYLENKRTNLLRDDQAFYRLIQNSVKARAKDIANQEETTTFVLNKKTNMPGAKAYQNLVNEYAAKPKNMVDKYAEKQQVLHHFTTPNLSSPQIDVLLITIAEEHISKYKYDEHTANDFYIEAVVAFVQNLPKDEIFLAVHVKMRKDLEKGKAEAKQYFKEMATSVQEQFKAIQDIQKIESASKATIAPKLHRKKVEAKKDEQVCRKFKHNLPCVYDPCPYKHDKHVKSTERIEQKPLAVKAKAKAKANVAVVSVVASASNIKSNDLYVCSYSLQQVASQQMCLDTGATATMSSDKNLFTHLTAYKTQIRVANKQIIHSTHKGTFNLRVALTNGKEIQLLFPDSLYVPSLSGTLISDQSILKLHFTITLDENGLFMKRDKEHIKLIRLSNGIITFPTTSQALISNVQASLPSPKVNSTTASQTNVPTPAPRKSTTIIDVPAVPVVTAPTSQVPINVPVPNVPTSNAIACITRKTLSLPELHVYHARFGHISIDSTIAILRSQNFSISDTLRNSFFCIDCAKSKSHALPPHSIGTDTLRSASSLQSSVIHTDVAGPITPLSTSGLRYVMSFRHEATNFFWTISIANLNQAVHAVNQYIIAMKNDILAVPIVEGKTILHSDSATIYIGKEMKEALAKQGIATSASTPYHPTANSIAERGFRTVFDLAKANMEQAAKLSEYITTESWPHAIEFSTLIMNLTNLSQGTSEKSAFEMILHKSPTTILLNILPFGCPVVVKIEKARTKFDPKGAVHIVLGYSLTSQSHKLWNPATDRITYSVNVQPDLSSFYIQVHRPPLTSSADYESSSIFDFKEPTLSSISEVNEDLSASPAAPAAPAAAPAALLKPPKCDLLDDFSDDESEIFNSAVSTPTHHAFNAAPTSLSKALNGIEAGEWRTAVNKECKSMISNEVWVEVKDTGQERIPSFLLLRRKADGSAKARIVAGGHKEKPGVHFDPNNISSSVLKSTSFKIIFCKGIELGLQIWHIDVITAFLNSKAKHVIFMTLPIQLADFGVPRLVKLLKGLYGTHDASRLWWDLLHHVLVVKLKFIQSTSDPCLYYHSIKIIILGVYVDDCPFVASRSDYEWLCTNLELDFKITTKGPMTQGLGIDVHQTIENGMLTSVTLSQESFITELLTQYGFLLSKPVYTPAIPNTFLVPDMSDYETHNDCKESTLSLKNFSSLVGSLLWLNLQTRPDISQATTQLTRSVSNPCPSHITAAKHLLRYLNGTRNLGITYSKSGNSTPQIYSDATWASDPHTQRSVNAYVVLLYGAAISWHCGTQKSVSLSTTESEYFALSETVKEAVYIKHALLQLNFASIKHWQKEPMVIFEDNQAVIKIIVGDIKHKHQKHILVRLAYVREQFQSNTIIPVYVPSADNIADVLTKNLPRDTFTRFQRLLLGILN